MKIKSCRIIFFIVLVVAAVYTDFSEGMVNNVKQTKEDGAGLY